MSYYDFNSRNKYFVMYANYRINTFHDDSGKDILIIHNKSLIGVDPYDENLTDEQKRAIMIECKRNIFYYFREVVKTKDLDYLRANAGLISVANEMENTLESFELSIPYYDQYDDFISSLSLWYAIKDDIPITTININNHLITNIKRMYKAYIPKYLIESTYLNNNDIEFNPSPTSLLNRISNDKHLIVIDRFWRYDDYDNFQQVIREIYTRGKSESFDSYKILMISYPDIELIDHPTCSVSSTRNTINVEHDLYEMELNIDKCCTELANHIPDNYSMNASIAIEYFTRYILLKEFNSLDILDKITISKMMTKIYNLMVKIVNDK